MNIDDTITTYGHCVTLNNVFQDLLEFTGTNYHNWILFADSDGWLIRSTETMDDTWQASKMLVQYLFDTRILQSHGLDGFFL